MTSHIPPSFARESLIFPPRQSRSHFNAKGGVSFAESRSFLTAGEQKPPVIGNFLNIDGKVGGPSSDVSTFSSTYDSPAPEIRLAEAAALTKAWHPANFQNSHILPSLSALPSQMQIRGQFGMTNAANIVVDQIHSEPGSNRSMSQVTLPQISSIRPGLVPVNLQSTARPSLVQPNLLMAQEARQNLPLPSSAPIPSNTMVPPLNYRYLAPGQGPPFGTTSSNLVPGVQSSLQSLNAPNMSFHVPGATLRPLPRGPLPGTTQALPIGQNIGQVAPSAPVGSGLSGLISSLMAQGLISLTKQVCI